MKKLISVILVTIILSMLLLTLSLASTLPIISENSDIEFDDLSEAHWAFDDIMSLVETGVLNGYEDGTFKPDNNITHAEMAKIITTAFDLHGNSESKMKNMF